MRRSLPDNRKPMPESCYEKRALPDAWREVHGKANYSWHEYKDEKEAIRRSQKITDYIEGYAGQLITG